VTNIAEFATRDTLRLPPDVAACLTNLSRTTLKLSLQIDAYTHRSYNTSADLSD
jgi:hypothetical protein